MIFALVVISWCMLNFHLKKVIDSGLEAVPIGGWGMRAFGKREITKSLNLKAYGYRTVQEALDRTFLVAKFFCALHVTNTYICTTALVYGPSMLPTFSVTGDLVLAERISIRSGKVGTGDVVLTRSPENPRKIVTKRIVGIEGDSVTYIVDPKNSDRRETLVVPKGHVWIEGDNIYASKDSRIFGPVPYGLLQGRVFWKIWPPEDFGSVGKRTE